MANQKSGENRGRKPGGKNKTAARAGKLRIPQKTMAFRSIFAKITVALTSVFQRASRKILTTRSPATWNTSPGELHKRRPCIVLAHSEGRAQVMPMTTDQSASNNPKNILISRDSFAKMHPRYTEKDSYALPDMIQTVSTSRIFPPQAADGKHPGTYAQYKLCSSDKNKVVSVLATQYNSELMIEKVRLEERLSALQKEKSKLFSTNVGLKESLKKYKEEVATLREKFLKLAQAVDLPWDFDLACKAVDEL